MTKQDLKNWQLVQNCPHGAHQPANPTHPDRQL